MPRLDQGLSAPDSPRTTPARTGPGFLPLSRLALLFLHLIYPRDSYFAKTNLGVSLPKLVLNSSQCPWFPGLAQAYPCQARILLFIRASPYVPCHLKPALLTSSRVPPLPCCLRTPPAWLTPDSLPPTATSGKPQDPTIRRASSGQYHSPGFPKLPCTMLGSGAGQMRWGELTPISFSICRDSLETDLGVSAIEIVF